MNNWAIKLHTFCRYLGEGEICVLRVPRLGLIANIGSHWVFPPWYQLRLPSNTCVVLKGSILTVKSETISWLVHSKAHLVYSFVSD